MSKYIIPYILSAACFLSACSDGYYNEPDPVANVGDSEMLSLTVSASDLVVADGLFSRSTEEGGVTTFEPNDSVGLIVLDKGNNLLVANVPYKYDGKNWNFDVEKAGEEKRPYYDGTMFTYIVYYPYTETADNCRSLDDIKGLDIFKYQQDQSTDGTYRQIDLMAWSATGEAYRSIKAEMKHVHDSFTLNTKIKWTLLPLCKEEEGEEEYGVLEYQPLRETLKNFSIVYEINGKEKIVLLNDEIDLTYHDKDGSYRYLLPRDKQEGTINWEYTYRNVKFRGRQDIDTEPANKRYLINESADMGELPGGNMQISDFYCRNEQNIGYVFPWDAWNTAEAERDFPGRHCIGLVVGVGQHENDFSNYSLSGIKGKRCEGYALSLTRLPEMDWAVRGTDGAKYYVGTNAFASTSYAKQDWSGFYNHQQIKKYAGTELANFPAAYACETYGNDCGLGAPDNSSGWFLPAAGMLEGVRGMENIETASKTYDRFDTLFDDRIDTLKVYLDSGKDPVYNEYKYKDDIKGFNDKWDTKLFYWTSNEASTNSSLGGKAFYSPLGTTNLDKYRIHYVRPYLAF